MDHRRELPLDKKGERLKAHEDFQLVISYNLGYQSLMKELKQSTKQRFVAMDFDYVPTKVEEGIVEREANIDADTAKKLVQIAKVARNLKGHGLDEGIFTRLLVCAVNLINKEIAPRSARRMALVRPTIDDADIRQTLAPAIDTIFV